MVLGVLGVGHLARSILQGLLRAGFEQDTIVLSPRGQGPELAQLHGLALARDNRDLVDRADIVLVAVRPADAVAALGGLGWTPRHTIVSVCAGVPIAALQAAAPAATIMRAMPLTATEIGVSATPVFPDIEAARPILNALGSVIALAREEDFEVATVSAAIYGWAQDLMRQSIEWSVAGGLERKAARQLVADTFIAAGRLIAEKDAPLDDMLRQLVTPGGITERGLQVLAERDVPTAWAAACEAVLEKLQDR